MNGPIERLVFSGGGIRGISYLGALMALRDMYDKEPKDLGLKEIAGCSVGSLVALLVVLQMSIKEMEQFLDALSLDALTEINVDALLSTFAMNDGSCLYDMTRLAFSMKNIPETVTFKELAALHPNGPKIHISVTDLNTASPKLFSVDTDPDMSVLKAVVASMSLPPTFAPVKHNGSLLCDGGLMNNFPVQTFPTKGTIGFRIAWYVDPTKPESILSYYTRVLSCIQVGNEKRELEYIKNNNLYVIMLDVGSLGTLRFDTNKTIREQISSSVLLGYRQANQQLRVPIQIHSEPTAFL